jgi:predicted aminopeptidase
MKLLHFLTNSYLIMSQPKKAVFTISLFIFILLVANCKIVFYGIEQGIGQLKLVHNSILIEDVLNDDSYPDSLKQKLLLVQQMKSFAIDSLGLNQSKNFNTVYDQKGETIVWIMYAAPRYEMSVYEWHYPVVGDLPYTGYFDKQKALKERSKMISKGYDIRIGTVTAWSTLGYFKDPILSSALFQTEGELAELIIHELTHSTLFLKGEAQFNENLATFIGEEGAKLYLIGKYGENSKEYSDYIGAMKDSKKVAQHILRGSMELDSLYKTFSENMDTTQKQSLKIAEILKIVTNLDTLDLYDTTIPLKYKNKIDKINNAYFAGFITYYDALNQFEEDYFKSYYPDLKNYINFLVEKYENGLN